MSLLFDSPPAWGASPFVLSLFSGGREVGHGGCGGLPLGVVFFSDVDGCRFGEIAGSGSTPDLSLCVDDVDLEREI